MHSEICPVCQGKGELKGIKRLLTHDSDKCHGCNGKGWVEVKDSVYPPYVPVPYVPPYDPYYPPYVPAPFDPGPWVCKNDQTQWTYKQEYPI